MTDTTENTENVVAFKPKVSAEIKTKRKSLAERKAARKAAKEERALFTAALRNVQYAIYSSVQEAARHVEDAEGTEEAFRKTTLDLHFEMLTFVQRRVAEIAGFPTFEAFRAHKEALEQAEHDEEHAADQAEKLSAVLAYEAGVPGFDCYHSNCDTTLLIARPRHDDVTVAYLEYGHKQRSVGGGLGSPIESKHWECCVDGYGIEIVDGKAVFRKLAA